MRRRRVIGALGTILGIAGCFLCAGGIVGAILVSGRVVGAVERVQESLLSLVAAGEEGLDRVEPELRDLRRRVAARAFEETRAELDRLRADVDQIRSQVVALAGLLEVREPRPRLESLSQTLDEASRRLSAAADRDGAGRAAAWVEGRVAGLRADLVVAREAVVRTAEDLIAAIRTGLLLVTLLFAWMGAGQACLLALSLRALRRRT